MQDLKNNTYGLAVQANMLFKNAEYAKAINLYRDLVLDHDRLVFNQNIRLTLKRLANSPVSTDNDWRPSVLFVTAGLKGPTPGGGIATCFFNMITELAKNSNAKITVLYAAHPYYGKGNFNSWCKLLQDRYNVRLVPLITNQKDYGSVEMKRSYAISKFLQERDGAFDRVVFHDFAGLGFYSLLSKRYGLMLQHTEITISAHGNHELSFYFGSKKVQTWSESAVMFMERSALRMADSVFTPSQYYADWMKEKFKVEHAKAQPNIITRSQETSTAQPIDISLTLGLPMICFYGRLERLKGLDVFIEAIKHLNENGQFFNLVFAGNNTKIDGVDSNVYITEKFNGSSNSIFFVLNTLPEPLFGFIRKNKGFCVYPTLGETSSCVVVESILESVPFIASDIPGIKELISPEHYENVLFKAGNSKSLSEAIARHAHSSSEDMNAQLSFDMQKNIEEWVTHLSRISRCRAPQPVTDKQDQTPLISIVVPTADRPELLEHAIISLRNQTYPHIEIIVVDDASVEAEKNEEICLKHEARYIKLPEKSYKGKACNVGVSVAQGDWVCFFDDDDLALPNMLTAYVTALSRDPKLDIISCFAGVFEHANWENGLMPTADYTSLAIGGNNETNFACNFFGKGTFIIRKDKFDLVKGYEEDAAAIPMVDYRFYIKSALNSLCISIIPKALYLYRKNSPNSLYYTKVDSKRTLYLAKYGIQKIFVDHFGEEMGRALIPHIWNISQPRFE